MFNISLKNSIFSLFLKYVIFFIFLAFTRDRFKNIVIDNANSQLELFKLTTGYALYILLYSSFLILIFSFPLYRILRIRKGIYFLLSMFVFLILEYLIYTYLYSPSDNISGIYNTIIGIIVLGLFFYKAILSKFKNFSF